MIPTTKKDDEQAKELKQYVITVKPGLGLWPPEHTLRLTAIVRHNKRQADCWFASEGGYFSLTVKLSTTTSRTIKNIQKAVALEYMGYGAQITITQESEN